ncbi:MAG TPA: flagellar basal body rod protein FlgC [Acidobacteriaceae bacterium]|nr:flagellar basal body rod protein FlgC [Acidobacteriaceae bacterium]
MNLFGVMEVSGSALEAERIRAEVVAANMANAETTRTADGGPYRRQEVVFTSEAPQESFGGQLLSASGSPETSSDAPIGGVRVSAVVADQGQPLRRYDPGHPDADKDGYVSYPDISPLTEMVDLMGATRAYGLNSSAVQAEKGMLSASLDILK